MPHYLPRSIPANSRGMLFIDGENLAIRYKNLLADGAIKQFEHVKHSPDIYVWTDFPIGHNHVNCALIRSHYCASVKGDDDKMEAHNR